MENRHSRGTEKAVDIFRILSIAVLGTALAVTIRPIRPEMAVIVGVVTGGIVLLGALNLFTGVLDTLREIATKYGIDSGYIGILLKIIGIAYAAQFGAQICSDAGESAVAGKVELCGRILILACATPAVVMTLDAAVGLLRTLT